MDNLKNILVMVSLNIILSSSGCYRYDESSDDKLTLEKGDYNGDELKIDGYYYRNVQNYKEEFLNIHFFYSNGIVRYGGGGYASFEKVEECILNNQIVPETSRTDWGVFHINE